jgi:hypothetical protein
MKRFVILTALLTFIAGTFATMVPAAARRPHAQRLQERRPQVPIHSVFERKPVPDLIRDGYRFA